MTTIRELNIKNGIRYFFKEIVNIVDMEPEYFMVNDFKRCKDGSIIFNLCYCSGDSVSHIVFNDIECIFRKCGVYSYLILCESDKNKDMINNYVRIVDKIKDEIITWVDDEFDDDEFNLGDDFIRLKFRTDDNLVYNEKINTPACVISLGSVIKKRNIYYLQLKLQKSFYKNVSFLKND